MKKTILKFLNWLALTAFLLTPSRLGDITRLAAFTLAIQQVSQTPLFAPNLRNDKTVFEVASSTFPVYDIAFSTDSSSRSKYFYGAQSLNPVPTFSLSQTPRKILIPESSIPANAKFVLTFDNPAADIVTQAKIFDITGAEVADMREETFSGSNPDQLSWDGRDKNGSIVRSGIYIYQVQAGGALINGTVVVAR